MMMIATKREITRDVSAFARDLALLHCCRNRLVLRSASQVELRAVWETDRSPSSASVSMGNGQSGACACALVRARAPVYMRACMHASVQCRSHASRVRTVNAVNRVESRDAALDTETALANFTYTYPATGTYTISFTGCCRLLIGNGGSTPRHAVRRAHVD